MSETATFYVLAVSATLMLYAGMLLLIALCKRERLDKWSDALKSWEEAHHEWKVARRLLRRAEKELDIAAEQDARQGEHIAAENLKLAGNSVNGAIDDVDENAHDIIVDRVRALKSDVPTYITVVPALVSGLLFVLGRVITQITAHQWLAGASLTVLATLNSYIYYSRFGFNVLPYLTDLSIDGLLAVVLFVASVVVLLFLVGCLLALSVILFVLVVLPLLIFVPVSMGVIAGGWCSRQVLWFCHSSFRFGKLSVVLGSRIAWFIARFRGVWSTVYSIVSYLTGIMWVKRILDVVRNPTGRRDPTGRDELPWTATRTIHSTALVLGGIGLTYIVSVEPQYRAHVACHDENRTEFVVQGSAESGNEVMARIGSNGNYLFATPVESCITQAVGDIEMASMKGHSSGEVQVNPRRHSGQAGGPTETGNTDVVNGSDATAERTSLQPVTIHARIGNWFREMYEFADRNVGFREPGIWKSVVFLTNGRRPDFSGPVVVLPTTRVRCMYEPGSPARVLPICEAREPEMADAEEELLRNQLAHHIRCGQLAISRPFVFMPAEWEQPIGRTDAQIDDFMGKHRGEREDKEGRTLYIYGFASADGGGGYNKQLALARAEAMRSIVQKTYSGWTIKTRSLGEDHLTNRVADSRSARLVLCADGSESKSSER